MPNFDGFTVALISQYDACTVPEYPPAFGNDPFIELPRLFETKERRVNVYTPTYPSSQFWVAYQIEPDDGNPEVPYYYFKLFIDGRHVVSWGCGKRQNFQGKTMFALYASPQSGNPEQNQRLETRVLFFGLEHDCNELDLGKNTMEIKIFRCRGRRVCLPELSKFKSSPAAVFDIHQQSSKTKNHQALGLFDAGPLMGDQPRDHYQYSLHDPVDRPFIVFRYLFRSIPQLRKLGILTAADDAQRSLGVNGPSKIFPTLSSRSMTTSIASDTDVARGLIFPMPVDSEQSPSPLRVPPILSIKTHKSPDPTDNDSPYSITVDLMETNFHKKLIGTRLYMNENTPISKVGGLPPISGQKEIEIPTETNTREQILKDCVSELLGQGRWRVPTPPVPTTTIAQPKLSLKGSLENLRLHQSFENKSTVTQNTAPIAGPEPVQQEPTVASDSQQTAKANPFLKPSHQQSMGSLKGVLRSAMRRAPRAQQG